MALGSYKQQTAVQDAETIRIGSVKLEIGPYGGGTYTDVGALRGATFKESWTDVEVKSDNAGILDEGITDHMVEINGEWFEINVANLGIAFAGIGTAATVAAAAASITDEEAVLNDTDQVELLHKMGSGAEVVSIVVTTSAAGAAVRNTDYVISVNGAGYTTIARIDGGVLLDGATALVDYDYTPLTSRTYTAGGKTSKSALMIRMTNYDVDDKEWVMLIHKAYIGDGINLAFPADDDRNPMPCPIKFSGKLDATRASGDQLFNITDSQDTT